MRYATLCSGIETPTVAWRPLGWKAVWHSEIEPFPNALLAHRYPAVPNLGDMTRIHENETYRTQPVDLICAGDECQNLVVGTLTECMNDKWGSNQWVDQQHYVLEPFTFQPRIARNGRGDVSDLVPALSTDQYHGDAMNVIVQPVADTISANWHRSKGAKAGNQVGLINPVIDLAPGVRRLTPLECERLQGFPDNYTRIPYRGKPPERCPDSPRYRAIGNAMPVPVMAWIGRKIHSFTKLIPTQ